MIISDWQQSFATWLRTERHRHNRRGHLAENSLSAYWKDLQDLARWFERAQHAPFMPGALTPEICEAYVADLRLLKRRPATINRHLASLRVFVDWARSRDYLSLDPTANIERMEVEGLPRDKTDEEYAQLKDAASRGAHLRRSTAGHALLALRDRIIFGLYAQVGLRCSEAASLDVDDVDLEQLRIRVRDGKGGTDKDVHMPLELADAISAWLAARSKDDRALISDWSGNRITAGQLRRRLEMIGDVVGIHVTPHDLRHTHACRLLDNLIQQGVDTHAALDAVRRQLRHKDVRTTLGYLRARRSQVLAAVNDAA